MTQISSVSLLSVWVYALSQSLLCRFKAFALHDQVWTFLPFLPDLTAITRYIHPSLLSFPLLLVQFLGLVILDFRILLARPRILELTFQYYYCEFLVTEFVDLKRHIVIFLAFLAVKPYSQTLLQYSRILLQSIDSSLLYLSCQSRLQTKTMPLCV